MIKLIENSRLPSVNFTDGFSVTKIKANLLAYGCNYSFLNVWCQQTEKGEITALLQKLENNISIIATKGADFNEIKDFVFVVGFSSIQAQPIILTELGLKFKEYQVLEFKGRDQGTLPPYPNIKDVFSLLYAEKNQNIKPTDFEGFYVDLSHKIRKGFAAAITTSNAVCVASHIVNTSAVISGVAVQNSARGSGEGSNILKQMLNALGKRTVYVAAEETVVPFYIKNGFLKSHKIAIYETEGN